MDCTSCWASVSSRWMWGVMREWSLARISSAGRADSRKPRACISHMHWLLCTHTHSAHYSQCPQRGGRCLHVCRRKGQCWRQFTHLMDFFNQCILQTKIHREGGCVYKGSNHTLVKIHAAPWKINHLYDPVRRRVWPGTQTGCPERRGWGHVCTLCRSSSE